MSVDFSIVKIGDRIRLTRENGDEYTFTVKQTESHGLSGRTNWLIDTETRAHREHSWHTLEILEKPLPTKAGAMLHNGKKGSSYFVLNSSGKWRNDSGEFIDESTIWARVRDGWKVVFEGLEYDA